MNPISGGKQISALDFGACTRLGQLLFITGLDIPKLLNFHNLSHLNKPTLHVLRSLQSASNKKMPLLAII